MEYRIVDQQVDEMADAMIGQGLADLDRQIRSLSMSGMEIEPETETMRKQLAVMDGQLADQEARISALEERARQRSVAARETRIRRERPANMVALWHGAMHSSMDWRAIDAALDMLLAGADAAEIRAVAHQLGVRGENVASIRHAFASRKYSVNRGVERDFARLTQRMAEIDQRPEVRDGMRVVGELMQYRRRIDHFLTFATARAKLDQLERRAS